jgi:hypothetical protein
MKIKLLFICAVLFLILGWNTKDGVLFFFFAIHVLTLGISVVALRYDRRPHPEPAAEHFPEPEPLPEIDPSESQGAGIVTEATNGDNAQPA